MIPLFSWNVGSNKSIKEPPLCTWLRESLRCFALFGNCPGILRNGRDMKNVGEGEGTETKEMFFIELFCLVTEKNYSKSGWRIWSESSGNGGSYRSIINWGMGFLKLPGSTQDWKEEYLNTKPIEQSLKGHWPSLKDNLMTPTFLYLVQGASFPKQHVKCLREVERGEGDLRWTQNDREI